MQLNFESIHDASFHPYITVKENPVFFRPTCVAGSASWYHNTTGIKMVEDMTSCACQYSRD